MKTILITGATRGLGLAIAQALNAVDGLSLVLAVRDVHAGEQVARGLRRDTRVVALDVGQQASIARFVNGWNEPLAGLVNNAGLQLTGPTSFTADGVEQTLAVNHLGALQLTLGLLPHLRGGRVLAIGSGTHHPEHPGATRFGFRGARYTTIDALARGVTDAPDDRQAGLDRYATSKLLGMVTMMEMARRAPQTTFLTLDPGMMPGTGLARTAPWYQRLAWSTVVKWLVPVLDDASTPTRSAQAARRLLLDDGVRSGEVYDAAGQVSSRVWPPAREPTLAARAVDESVAFLGPPLVARV